MNVTPLKVSTNMKQISVNLKNDKELENNKAIENVKYNSVPSICYKANAITFGNSKTACFDYICKRETKLPKNLSDVSGLSEVKEKLMEVVNNVKTGNKKGSSGVLLYGSPGCGKTYVSEAISGEAELPLYKVTVCEVGGMAPRQLTMEEERYALKNRSNAPRTKAVNLPALLKADTEGRIDHNKHTIWEDETFKNIRKIYEQLIRKSRDTGEGSILLFDDADAIFDKMDVSAKELMTKYMDEAKDNGIITVFTTNRLGSIDPVVRDHPMIERIEIKEPNYNERVEIIKDMLSKKPAVAQFAKDDELIAKLADASSDLQTSRIKYGIDDAIMKAINKSENLNDIKVTEEDLIFSMLQKNKS